MARRFGRADAAIDEGPRLPHREQGGNTATSFCSGSAPGAHRKGVSDEGVGSVVEVVDSEELRWPAVDA
jgi:hypothetical protein